MQADPTAAGSHRPPQPRTCNTCRLEHTHGLATSVFARHYSRNHNCFLFLRVLRCFTSPRYLPHPYTFRAGSPDMTPDIQGFPIRTSPDHSSFTNSPGLIAGYNVLHRLLVPRHPPIALSSLSHNKQQNHKTKMLASTMQFSTTTRDTHHTPTHAATAFAHPGNHTSRRDTPEPQQRAPPQTVTTANIPQQEHTTVRHLLLRKEVIQPHLPVRLPCYDLVLITSPTFDSSPTKSVRPPASSVTDFHDLTGGVYKPRERIHRSVADLRLLATPTSWGRVADPNPN